MGKPGRAQTAVSLEKALGLALFERLEKAFETLDGYMVEINRDFRMQTDLDKGEIYPIDETLAGYDPSTAPKFEFPARLKETRNRIRAAAEQRSTKGSGSQASQSQS